MIPRVILASLLWLMMSWGIISSPAYANSTVGQWSLGPVWPIAPINMMMLPDGKVMFYPGNNGISGDDARTWDPATGSVTSLPRVGYDLFCTGHSFLRDGTALLTGGHIDIFVGLPDASVYDPFTNVWSRKPDMNAGRWYPSSTTMDNGDVLIMTGMIDTVQYENPLPQVWQPSSGTWRDLTSAVLKIYNYSWVFHAPFGNGKAIVAGPERQTRVLDTAGTGSWSFYSSFNYPDIRDYGSAAMYDTWHVLIAGGGQPPTNTAEVLNMADPSNPVWQPTGSMAFARRHMTLTLLPDDTVLATGGTSATGFNDPSQPVYAAEIWNPNTGVWTTMASQTVGRFYHSMAMLLPDGRVLSSGGDYTYQTEIFSPPYLFKGVRPTITSAPTHVNYAQSFFVETPDAQDIAKVRLIRLPAVTHAFDQNQRLVPLSYTQTAGGLTVNSPEFYSKAPPGHYMLFIVNSNQVPSAAKIIQVDDGAAPPPPPTPTVPSAPTGLVATPVSRNRINLSWTDQANNEDGFKIERQQGTGSFTQIATVGPNVTTFASTGLRRNTQYSYRVRAYNSAGNSAYSNTATARTFN